MEFKELFELCEHPEKLVWIVQDNTTNEQDIYEYIDFLPIGCENLKIERYYMYAEGNTVCVYVACKRQ